MVVSIIGEADYLQKQKTYRVQYKWSIPDLRDIKKELQQILKDLQEDWGNDGT